MNPPEPNRPPHDRFRPAQALAFALACAACLILNATQPETWLNLEEWGAWQNTQNAVLFLALVLIVRAAVRAQYEARAAFVFVLGFIFFLFWRELDLDKELFGARMFSWTYLEWSEDKMSWRVKVLLGGLSIGLSLGYLAFVLLNPRRIFRGLRDRMQPAVVLWGGIGGLFLALAQLWDKAAMIYRHLHVTIRSPEDKDPFDEEALELLGEIGMLLFVLALVRTVPRPPREAWTAFATWFDTPAGLRLRRAVGLLLGAAGLAVLAWSLYAVFDYRPEPFDYRFTIAVGNTERGCEYAFLGLTRNQIALRALGAGLGLGACGLGSWLLLNRVLRLRALAAIALLALPGFAFPFLWLTPSSDRSVQFEVRLPRPLSESEAERLMQALEPVAAMRTLPEGLLKRFRFQPGDGIKEFRFEPAGERFLVALLLAPKTDTRRRLTLMEFYAQYAELLARDLALSPDAAQEPWTRYGAPPIQGSLWSYYAPIWLEARNADRAAGRTP
ncbi:MAG: hypothetical protein AMXMBFR7_35740 [Planctomycetota bacterium]